MAIAYDARSPARPTWPRPRASRPTTRSTSTRFLEDAIELRRRRAVRRRAVLRGRRARAHRGGWHPLGRLGLLHAAVLAVATRMVGAAARASRASSRCACGVRGPAQRAVRRQGRVSFTSSRLNPRASRTVPFVLEVDRRAPGSSMAARIMAGEKIRRPRPARPRTAPRATYAVQGGRHARSVASLAPTWRSARR